VTAATNPMKSSRKQLIRRARLRLLNRVLHKVALRNIEQGFPAIAIFAFDHVSQQVNLFGRYENDELVAFFEWARLNNFSFAGTTALDVGANIGNHALFFSSIFNQVIAFEPNPRTFKLLEINTSDVSNISIFHFGLSDTNSEATMYSLPINIGGSTIVKNGQQVPITSLLNKIKLRSLDDLGIVSNVSLIKIDVEGHELSVLRGSERVIRQNKPFVLFEYIPSSESASGSDVMKLLKEFGYQEFVTLQKNQLNFPNRYLKFAVNLVWGLIFNEKWSFQPINNFSASYSFVVAVPPNR